MRKQLLSLVVLASAAGLSAQTLVTNETIGTAITDGTVIALSCQDTNGGVGYYFNGAGVVKTTALQFSNLFQVVRTDDTDVTYYLQRLTDGSYIGKNAGTITSVAEAASAAHFTIGIAEPTGWTTKPDEVLPGVNTVRFTAEGQHLNAQGKASNPCFAGGTGGYSIWYVYTFTKQELLDLGKAGLSSIAERAQGFGAMKGAIGNEECPTVTVPENATPLEIGQAIGNGTTLYQNYINKFNGKLVNLKNNRRDVTNGQTPWLAVYLSSDGNAQTNTLADQNSDYAVWQMVVTNNMVQLYNLTSGYSAHSSSLIPAAVNGGVRLQPNGQSKYMNVNTYGGSLEWYSVADDPGSIWTVTPADYDFCQPEVSTAEAPKYYRILSDRCMTNHTAPALGIDGESRANASGAGERIAGKTYGHFGQYWRLEAGDTEGTVKFVNLVDGYEMGTVNNAKEAIKTLDGNGSEYHLHRLAGVTVGGAPFNIDNSYALGQNNSYSGNCLDANNSFDGSATNFQWNPTGDGHNNLENNGSVWYFVLADESEIASVTSKYLNTVKQTVSSNQVDLDTFAALCGEDVVTEAAEGLAAAIDAVNNATNISELNKARRESYAALNAVSNLVDNYVVGQHIQLRSAVTDDAWSGHYLVDNGTKLVAAPETAEAYTSANGLNSLWTIRKGTQGYIFVNEYTGKAIGNPVGNSTNANSDIPVVEEADAQEFQLTYNANYKAFGIHKVGSTIGDTQAGIHMSTGNSGIVTHWAINDIAGSHWIFSALEDAGVQAMTEDQTQGTFHLILDGPVTEYAVTSGKALTITPVSAVAVEGDETSTPAITIAASEFVDSANRDRVLLDRTRVPEGSYVVSVPGAMITKDGKHTRAAASTFSVNADGTTTGIAAVGAAGDAPKRYFDLQGRRVLTPSRGIYICNGKKVYIR